MALTALQNSLSAKAIILLYHRITCTDSDPQRLAVTPEHFDQQMDVLKQMTEPVTLQELLPELKTRTCSDTMLSVVTFDDGYTDNLLQALPILRKHSVPATFFVITATINQSHECWWDALARCLLRDNLPEQLRLDINGTIRTWQFEPQPKNIAQWNICRKPFHTAHKVYTELARFFHTHSHQEKDRVLRQLHSWAHIDPAPRPEYQTMTENQLRTLDAEKLAAIGAHTMHHSLLSNLPPEQQQMEIVQSRKRLENILNHPVTTFSYPYGCIEDYNRASLRILRNGGFTSCCSNFPQLTNRFTDPRQLPRFVVGDWNGFTFKQHLLAWCRQ